MPHNPRRAAGGPGRTEQDQRRCHHEQQNVLHHAGRDRAFGDSPRTRGRPRGRARNESKRHRGNKAGGEAGRMVHPRDPTDSDSAGLI